MSKVTIEELCLRHGADKGSLNYHGEPGHDYARQVYDKAFEDLRERPIRLLEVGVWKGQSMRMWLDCFPLGEIVGMDISLRRDMLTDIASHERLVLLEHDSTTLPPKGLVGPFDIIIDDGRHTPGAQWSTYNHLRPLLKDGGTYWIEEVCRSAWVRFKRESEEKDFFPSMLKLMRTGAKLFDCRRSIPKAHTDSMLMLMR